MNRTVAPLIVLHFLGFPHDLVDAALDAAVEVVGTVVDGQLVFLAVQRELALGDTVGDAAGGGAEVMIGLGLVAGHVVEAEDHVGGLAVLVGDVQLDQGGAVGDDLGAHPFGILESISLNWCAVGSLAEIGWAGDLREATAGRDRHEQTPYEHGE